MTFCLALFLAKLFERLHHKKRCISFCFLDEIGLKPLHKYPLGNKYATLKKSYFFEAFSNLQDLD